MPNNAPAIKNLCVLIPVYDDWVAADLLVSRLGETLDGKLDQLSVILIDDGSTVDPPDSLAANVAHLRWLEVSRVVLKRNLGHQRALAIGLAHVANANANANAESESVANWDAVAIMDGDGEDDPADVPRLIAQCSQCGAREIVFAERTQRSENLVFRIGYLFYRHLHHLLTGHRIRFGNFSVVPGSMLGRVASISEIWNHYAAAVVQSGLPYSLLPTARARRLTGESKMNHVGLVVHGLSAISVYGEKIGVKLLMASVVSLILLVLSGLALVGLRIFTDLAIPGWASVVGGLLVILFIQTAALSLQFAFLVLQSRAGASFIPSRDYAHFIERIERL